MLRFVLRRLLAYVLDIAILYAVLGGILQTLTSAVFGVPDYGRLAQSPVRLEGWVLLTISLPTWLYFIYSDVSGGQTLGKRLLGLQVQSLSGEAISIEQAIPRTALKLMPWELTHLSVLVPNPMWNAGAEPAVSQYVGLVAANLLMLLYLVVLLRLRGHRTIHDLVAGTAVVRAVKAEPASGDDAA